MPLAQTAPHPNPLPCVQARGNKTRQTRGPHHVSQSEQRTGMQTSKFAPAVAFTLLFLSLSAFASPPPVLPVTQPAARPATRPTVAPRREFFFTYEATVTGLTPGQVARIWAPVPPNND